jgi:hypothetical protein
MNPAPALTANPQILRMVFQTAFLAETGRGRELVGALRDQRFEIHNLEGFTQVESFHRFMETNPAMFGALERSLSFLQQRNLVSYRDASRDLPDRRTTVAGHEMVGIPGGWYVRGHGRYGPADGWVKAPPFFIGRDLVSRRLFRDLAERRPEVGLPREPDWDARDDEPVVNVTAERAVRFARALREESSEKFRLPTREEWEIAARGPAVCLNRLMEEEEGRFRPGDLPDFAKDRFQNFFFELGGEIFWDPADRSLRKVLREGRELYAYRVFDTVTGREPVPRPMLPRTPSGKTRTVLRAAPVIGGLMESEMPLPSSPLASFGTAEENVWGVRNLTQSLWQCLGEGVSSWVVGGSYLSQNPNYFRATAVIKSAGGAEAETGLRLALSVR